MRVHSAAKTLHVPLEAPHRAASWAVWGGGMVVTSDVVWREVTHAELSPPTHPEHGATQPLKALDLPMSTVVLLTSRNVTRHLLASRTVNAITVDVLATIGLSNRLRVGDPPGHWKPGTINVLCVTSVPLTDTALLEGLAIAAEARTAAVLDAGLPSLFDTGPASGTGTDCFCVAAPLGNDPHRYAGKHTALGSALGGAVLDAVGRGVVEWREENGWDS